MKRPDTHMTNERPFGAERLAEAIAEARKIMFQAPWVVESPNPLREKAAAERQLKHQLAAALDQGFVVHDPLRPVFRTMDQHNQFGLFNPDNRYLITNIRTPGTYVIRGQRGTSADLQIQVAAGETGFEEDIDIRTVSLMSLEDLVVEPNGDFEIIVSETPIGKNWLPNTNGGDKATSILIRESFMDWETEKGGTWYIERTDSRGTPSPLPDRRYVDEQYERAAKYLVASCGAWIKFVDGLRREVPARFLTPPVPTEDGLPGQLNSLGHFPIDADEAIVITLARSSARYQSIQIGDLWFNSLDYGHRQTSLSMGQATPSSDGQYRLVVSAKDPGVANWLDSAGASTVFAFLRWQGLPDNTGIPTCDYPVAKVVPFEGVRDCLPPDEAHFGPEERREQLAARQRSCLTNPRGF